MILKKRSKFKRVLMFPMVCWGHYKILKQHNTVLESAKASFMLSKLTLED